MERFAKVTIAIITFGILLIIIGIVIIEWPENGSEEGETENEGNGRYFSPGEEIPNFDVEEEDNNNDQLGATFLFLGAFITIIYGVVSLIVYFGKKGQTRKLKYIEDKLQKMETNEKKPEFLLCPECERPMKYIDPKQDWYCEVCKEYETTLQSQDEEETTEPPKR